MARSLPQLLILVPLLVAGSCVLAAENSGSVKPFGFNPSELELIQYSRAHSDAIVVSDTAFDAEYEHVPLNRQTQFSFKLKPKRPSFTRKGAYGLDLFTDPRLDVKQRLSGPSHLDEAISQLNDGFVYSAGVKIEHDDEDIDGTAYVSSSQLGLSYGRLGRHWYGGIDVNLEQFADELYGEQPDILSLDVTTGRRLGFTGLSAHSPLWLLSVQGNFDMHDEHSGDESETKTDWFLNPSLFWQQPGFTFSAQMQLPIEFETYDDQGDPDYRLRAVFEKQFK